MDWNEMAAGWVRHQPFMEASFAPVLDRMLAHATLSPGMRVLDIGFGTGDSVAAVLAQLGEDGRITGLDIADHMVARARDRVDGRATLLVGDAQSHGFAPNGFDAAISKFGTMFFEDTGAAFANIRASLVPGARFSFAAWAGKAANPWFRIPAAVAQGRLGKAEPVPETAPGPFRFERAEPVLALLEAAGWREAAVSTEALSLTPKGGPDEMADVQMQIGPAASVMDEKQAGPEDRAAIRAELARAYGELTGPEGLRLPAEIHFFTARA